MVEADKYRKIRKKAAECIRQLLAGRVSPDHVIEEFGRTGDAALSEAVRLIEEEAAGFDRYAKLEGPDIEFRKRMEKMAERLDS
jgi:hypothetical protein